MTEAWRSGCNRESSPDGYAVIVHGIEQDGVLGKITPEEGLRRRHSTLSMGSSRTALQVLLADGPIQVVVINAGTVYPPWSTRMVEGR